MAKRLVDWFEVMELVGFSDYKFNVSKISRSDCQ